VTTVVNPRLAAYCRAVGIAPTAEAVRERDGNYAEFIVWVNQRMQAWQKAKGINRYPLGRDEDADFTAFWEKAAEGGAS